MTTRLGLALLALLVLSACEDLTDLLGVGAPDAPEFGVSEATLAP